MRRAKLLNEMSNFTQCIAQNYKNILYHNILNKITAQMNKITVQNYL